MNLIKKLNIFSKHIAPSKNILCLNRRGHSNIRKNDFDLPVYSHEQQLQILETLQKCVENNIIRTHLNEKRLQSLRLLFEQNPNLQTLEPLLTINGLGPKILHKLCDSILLDVDKQRSREDATEDNEDNEQFDIAGLRLPTNLIIPSKILQHPVKTVVSIELGINAISWARLNTVDVDSGTMELDDWNILDLSDNADQKFDVHTIWDLVMHLRDEIPDSDVLVMENNNWSNISNVKKPMKYHLQEAMITTAICSIFNQTNSGREPRSDSLNRLYFLRTFTSSRLFRKIVGSERVSAQDVVQAMINGESDERYRPFAFTNGTAEQYLSLNGSLKENLCRALLLVVSFTELILRQNPAALSVIGRPAGRKKV